jgi:hypothetical protein
MYVSEFLESVFLDPRSTSHREFVRVPDILELSVFMFLLKFYEHSRNSGIGLFDLQKIRVCLG